MTGNYQSLTTELSDHILTITLNRPDKLNALSGDLLDELLTLFQGIKNNKDIHGLLITGAGKAFCAGADINHLAEVNGQSGYEFAIKGQTVFRTLEQIGIPSVAAVNGYSFGGGCELAMAATIRFASTKASFGQPEVKLGVIPGYGGTQRLARLVGKGRAMDLCLSGRFIKADEALAWGLVNKVTEPDDLLSESRHYLKTILSMGPLAVKSAMEVIHSGYDLSLDEALHLEAVHFGLTCASRDKQEGVSAFLEKRDPNFIGE